jgi:hypothetical protein
MDDDVAVAATSGVAQVFDLHALKAFAPDKRVRKMLFKTDQLWSEIACYEPGQSDLGPDRCVIMFLKVNPRTLKSGSDG